MWMKALIAKACGVQTWGHPRGHAKGTHGLGRAFWSDSGTMASPEESGEGIMPNVSLSPGGYRPGTRCC